MIASEKLQSRPGSPKPPAAEAEAAPIQSAPPTRGRGIRLLILTRYTPLGASSRLRMHQYVPALEQAGFDVVVSPLSNDSYIRDLYTTDRRHLGAMLHYYADRRNRLTTGNAYDLIWIEKEVFPFLPGRIDAWSLPRRIPYVLDYDDATFHRYDQHRSRWVRCALGNKLRPLLRSASAVTAGNPYLADYAKRAGAARVEIVPTVVDIGRYPINCPPLKTNELRIGWIGSPTTTPYLELVKGPLEELARRVPLRLVTVGAAEVPGIQVPTEQHPWTEETEAALLASCHLGIMPLRDGLWERGKCGYKLIQYMACGLPVAASPVGVNQDIVTPEVGFLCNGDADWLKALHTLASNEALRRQLGQAGRKAVERRYSLQVQTPIVIDILRGVMQTPRRPP